MKQIESSVIEAIVDVYGRFSESAMIRCLLLLVLAGVLLAQDPPVTRRRQLPIRLVTENIGQVVAATLWISIDQGRTWQQSTTINRPQPADEPIIFSFQPDEERMYGFRTTEVLADGRREEAPAPGTRPAVSVIFDFSPPNITYFEITPVERRRDVRTVTVEWASKDDHPHDEAARLYRHEDEQWHAVGDWLPPSGITTLTVPADAPLRMLVRDRAGNQSTADAWQPPDDADTTVTQPVAPAPVPIVGPAPPFEPALAPDVDDPAPGVADHLAAVMPVFGEDIADSPLPPDIERDFRVAQRARRAGREAQLPPRFTGQQGPAETEEQTRPQTATSQRPSLLAAGTPPAIILRQARAAVTAGDDAQALVLYRRLADSPLAATGLAEELAVLERLGRRREALELVRISPPEALSDPVRCIQVRLKLALRDFDGARRVLRHIPLDSPERRQAQVLEAQVLFATGDRASARAILHRVAQGDDGWAAVARALLDP